MLTMDGDGDLLKAAKAARHIVNVPIASISMTESRTQAGNARLKLINFFQLETMDINKMFVKEVSARAQKLQPTPHSP